MTPPKLALDVPDPPPITPEVVQQLREEAACWAREMRERIRAIENLTPEDWSAKTK